MATSETGSLLNQLRIDRRARQGRRRWPWVLGALALLGVLGAVWMSRGPLLVETAKARSAQDSGPISLLDASGFVTARRIATVSAKITGKVAQFGRGVLADVSAKLLSQFVSALEADVLKGASTPGAEPASSAAPSQPSGPRRIESAPSEPVDLIATAGSSVMKRVAPIALAVAIALWLLLRN